MKRIGLLGGMSWESSIEYYRLVNEITRDRLGGLHSADCLLRSVDFADIERLQRDGRWEEAGERLAAEARALVAGGAELLVLCTNTMHKVADAITDAVAIPFVNIADTTAAAVRAHGFTNVGLLATGYTMEQDFYAGRLRDVHGLEVLVPGEADRRIVHDVIYDELCVGVVDDGSREQYRRIMRDLADRGAQAILLGCTEIDLLVGPEDAPVPVFDTTRLHAERAVDLALKPDGETISDGPARNVIILAEHEDVTITWSRFSPGERGPDLHVHHEHTDAFYVLDGELTFELGPDAEKVRVGPGGFVAVPPHVGHSFVNESDADARWLNFHAPDCGFADFMRTLRAGAPGEWDSFDMPAGGGLAPDCVTVSDPGAGERLSAGSRMVCLKGVADELCVAEWDIDGLHEGPAAHRHDRQVHAFYVIEGELEMTIGDELHVAGPGTLTAIPRGVEHTFNHRRDGRARVLDVRAPGRLRRVAR